MEAATCEPWIRRLEAARLVAGGTVRAAFRLMVPTPLREIHPEVVGMMPRISFIDAQAILHP
jgi:hypothetical protein